MWHRPGTLATVFGAQAVGTGRWCHLGAVAYACGPSVCQQGKSTTLEGYSGSEEPTKLATRAKLAGWEPYRGTKRRNFPQNRPQVWITAQKGLKPGQNAAKPPGKGYTAMEGPYRGERARIPPYSLSQRPVAHPAPRKLHPTTGGEHSVCSHLSEARTRAENELFSLVSLVDFGQHGYGAWVACTFSQICPRPLCYDPKTLVGSRLNAMTGGATPTDTKGTHHDHGPQPLR